MTYLLDTNAVSDAATNHPLLREHFERVRGNHIIGICSITLGELLFGIARMPSGRRRDSVQETTVSLIGSMACFAISPDAATHYSKAKLFCYRNGMPVMENDLWIAATALVLKATLVTRDADFTRIGGLTVEDWTK